MNEADGGWALRLWKSARKAFEARIMAGSVIDGILLLATFSGGLLRVVEFDIEEILEAMGFFAASVAGEKVMVVVTVFRIENLGLGALIGFWW